MNVALTLEAQVRVLQRPGALSPSRRPPPPDGGWSSLCPGLRGTELAGWAAEQAVVSLAPHRDHQTC